MFKIEQTLTKDPHIVWQTLKNFDDPAYRRMDSRKRTLYISKKKFTERSKIAREMRKCVKKGRFPLRNFKLGRMRVRAGRSVKANKRFALSICLLSMKIICKTYDTSSPYQKLPIDIVPTGNFNKFSKVMFLLRVQKYYIDTYIRDTP